METIEQNVINQLQNAVTEGNITELKETVIKSVLGNGYNDEEVQRYMKEVLVNGCQSGVVTELVYYSDTYDFYDNHEDDIQDLVGRLSEQGIYLELHTFKNLKNDLAWLAYEETVRELLDEYFGGW